MPNEVVRRTCLAALCLLGGSADWCRAQTQDVRVVTWNVHKPSDPAVIDQQMSLVASMNPDIVVLQEVRTTVRAEYASRLAQHTSDPADTWVDEFMAACRTANPDQTCAIDENNGPLVMTRLPKVNSSKRMFWYADGFVDGRSIVQMAVNANGTTLNVFSVHLPFDSVAGPQMVIELKNWAASFASPRLMGGDFNANPGDPAIASADGMTGSNGGSYVDAWVAAPGSGDGITHGTRRFDYWFSEANGTVSPIAAAVTSSALSDHNPLLVTYRIAAPQPPTTGALKINFQPAGAAPDGYLADIGLAFGPQGNGHNYGWNIDNTGQTRERHSANSPDRPHDTLIYMQKSEIPPNTQWEIEVPSGTYYVRVVAGDPSFSGNNIAIAAEGTLVVSGTTTDTQHWLDNTVRVPVTDGRLTISNAPGADSNKICFIEIAEEVALINFQPAGTAPDGYLADTGLPFADRGNGLSYGWNIDNTGQARERHSATSPDRAHDTLIYMQKTEIPPNTQW